MYLGLGGAKSFFLIFLYIFLGTILFGSVLPLAKTPGQQVFHSKDGQSGFHQTLA